jgi:hypothetical protein
MVLYQYPTRDKSSKPITACAEPSPGLSGIVMQITSLASQNYRAGLTSKWRLLYVSLFLRVFVIRGDSQERHRSA